MSYNQTITTGSLVPRVYSDFRGVDFSNKDVALTRSPDSINMYKDYKNDLGKTIETRPGIELQEDFANTIFGLFFYKVNNVTYKIVHSGTKLYANGQIIHEGMKPDRSKYFVFDKLLYILDGLNYLVFDGKECKDVEGYIPTTSIACKPSGGGTAYNGINLLSDYRRNTFIGDGESTEYYVDTKDLGGFDNDFIPKVTNTDTGRDIATTEYSWDGTKGKITFRTAPEEPMTDGRPNITITFKKHVEGNRERISHCKLVEVFDNRVFFSGCTNYPNIVFNSGLDDPTYVSEVWYAKCGTDDTSINAMAKGNNIMWIFKEPSQTKDGIYYLTPQIDYDVDYKVYPSVHSSISTGCVSTGTNFNDDIVFLSDRGLEGIANSDINAEQLLAHRSSLVDSKMLSEINYKKALIEEWEGYLLVIIDNKVYLADSRKQFTNDNHNEYEWYYWELEKSITSTLVKDNILYLGTDTGIYTLTGNSEERNIISYWTTPEDNFKTARFLKTTNKRGCQVDMVGKEINVSTKLDYKEWEENNTYTNTKGYVVPRIKKKKWRTIQLKLSSNKPFGLYAVTLESYVGGYVKR